MAESGEISIALTPVQLFAILNGKSISEGELASNSWHEMPGPSRGNFMPPLSVDEVMADSLNYLGDSVSPGAQFVPPTLSSSTAYSSRQDSRTPPARHSLSSSTMNRAVAALEIVGGGAEILGGVLLLLTPEPTMLTKVLGGVMTVHGTDFTQAAIRQLFSGKRVEDFTEQGATWTARHVGASPRTAQRVGVVMDVTVGLADMIVGATRVVAIRMGRIILSEEAVAGKMGRVSLDVEEADETIGKEGGHTKERHVEKSDNYIEDRAMKSQNATKVFSRFASKRIAEDAINDCIRANRKAMQRWAANPNGVTTKFEFEVGSPIGDGFFNSDGTYKALTKVRVILKFAKTGPKSFYIVSAFPVP